MSQLASPVEIYWISGSPIALPAPADWVRSFACAKQAYRHRRYLTHVLSAHVAFGRLTVIRFISEHFRRVARLQ
jgi:hypothetical protein